MTRSREFLAGLIAIGAAQFLWTVFRLVVFLAPNEWVFGSISGIVLGEVLVVLASAFAVLTREPEVTFRAALGRFGAGAGLGMVATVFLSGGGAGAWLTAILFGAGLLLPAVAVGTVAGDLVRRLRRSRR